MNLCLTGVSKGNNGHDLCVITVMKLKRARAKNELRNKSIVRMLVMGRIVIRAIAKIIGFPDSAGNVPALDGSQAQLHQISRDVDVLEKLLASARQKQKQAVNEFKDDYRKVATTVNSWAKGRPSFITEAGFRHWLPGNQPKRGQAPRITRLKAKPGAFAGSAELSWKALGQKRVYQIWVNSDPKNAEGWQFAGAYVKAKAIIKGLTPGQRLWFRVMAIHPDGPPSNTVDVLIPF